MEFDIEEFKAAPERRLILRNRTRQSPQYWKVEQIQVSLGDVVVIKVPQAINRNFPEYAALDKDYNLMHGDYGITGTLEFASEKLSLSEFIDRLIALPVDCSIDFSCADDDNSAAFGVTKLKRFDTTLLLFSRYGDKCCGCYDTGNRFDKGDLEEYLKYYYLEDYYEGYIYIDTARTDMELWGVTFEFENVDGSVLRILATSDNLFFKSRQEAEQWIAEHPYKDFDEGYDNDYCSNPRPVLLDRWTVRGDGTCIQHI